MYTNTRDFGRFVYMSHIHKYKSRYNIYHVTLFRFYHCLQVVGFLIVSFTPNKNSYVGMLVTLHRDTSWDSLTLYMATRFLRSIFYCT